MDWFNYVHQSIRGLRDETVGSYQSSCFVKCEMGTLFLTMQEYSSYWVDERSSWLKLTLAWRDVVKGPERGDRGRKPLYFLFGHQTWVRSGFCLSVISLSANRSLFGFPKKDQDSNTDCKESARVLFFNSYTLRLYGGVWAVVCVWGLDFWEICLGWNLN